MSWSDDELDDLVNDAIRNFEIPPYQDSFFDEFEAQFPNKKRKPFAFWILIPALLILTGSVMTYTLLSDLNINTDKNATQKLVSTLGVEQDELGQQVGLNTEKQIDLQQKLIQTDQQASPIELTTNQVFQAQQFVGRKQTPTKTQSVFLTKGTVKQASHQLEIETTLGESTHSNETPHLAFQKLYLPLFLNENKVSVRSWALPKHERKYNAYLQVGLRVTESYLFSEASKKPWYGASIEIGYQVLGTHKKVGLETGLRFSQFKTQAMNLNRSSKIYGFGVDYFEQQMSYKSVSSLEVTARLIFNGKNNRIGVALNPSLNLGSNINFKKIKNGELLKEENFNYNRYGMRKWGLSPEISYHVKLPKGLEFGISTSVQLINPLQEEYFTQGLKKNVFSAQIQFKKSLQIK